MFIRLDESDFVSGDSVENGNQGAGEDATSREGAIRTEEMGV